MSSRRTKTVMPGALEVCPKRDGEKFHRFERRIRAHRGGYQDGLFCEFCSACLYKWQTVKNLEDPLRLMEGLTGEDVLSLEAGGILTRRYVGEKRLVVKV